MDLEVLEDTIHQLVVVMSGVCKSEVAFMEFLDHESAVGVFGFSAVVLRDDLTEVSDIGEDLELLLRELHDI